MSKVRIKPNGDTYVTFAASVLLPSTKISDDLLDVVVTAHITPSDDGGLHCPPSGPIPEITSVVVDPHADVDGTRYERGDDVTALVGLKDIEYLEDQAIGIAIQEEKEAGEPPDWEEEE